MRESEKTLNRRKKTSTPTCHSPASVAETGLPLIAIVGNPNVGKSVLFNALTGAYVTVSNYPGTTVGVARGKGKIGPLEIEVVDTPGMYRMLPITEEERVARGLLLNEHPSAVLHVIDAKNIRRMLPMTLQLIQAGLPLILVVNMMDEADRLGIKLSARRLEQELGVPVIPTALAVGRGKDELKKRLLDFVYHRDYGHSPQNGSNLKLSYPPAVNEAIRRLTAALDGDFTLKKQTIALLLLQDDAEIREMVREKSGANFNRVQEIASQSLSRLPKSISYLIAGSENEAAQKIIEKAVTDPERPLSSFKERLSRYMIHPITGIPLLLLSLYLFYEFVGVLGSQTLVDFLENSIFGRFVNPFVDKTLLLIIPWQAVRDLFGGQYGIITLGIRYAIAIILPVVGTFFMAFSVIEDSGYLPRLALLIDRLFKKIGLNGRAVIPMVLGFGCDTMATIVTRTLETKRERIISTLLLSLAIPCSAQLGVLMGMLAGRPVILILWTALLIGIFLLVGFLSARLMPGTRPSFYIELPPLRFPKIGNVLTKTYSRMEWYFREVFPLFILASVLIWFGRITGLFQLLIDVLRPMVRWIGLPDQTAVAFLFGFFRRDYGAAGLYDLRNMMTGNQLLIAVTTMTLFIPCIAQFSVTIKERGWKTALAMFVFILIFAFLVGEVLFQLLTILRVQL